MKMETNVVIERNNDDYRFCVAAYGLKLCGWVCAQQIFFHNENRK